MSSKYLGRCILSDIQTFMTLWGPKGYMAMAQGYTSVKVPRTLANRITEVAPDRGYRNVSEFVLEWTRRGLDEVEK